MYIKFFFIIHSYKFYLESINQDGNVDLIVQLFRPKSQIITGYPDFKQKLNFWI